MHILNHRHFVSSLLKVRVDTILGPALGIKIDISEGTWLERLVGEALLLLELLRIIYEEKPWV